PGLFLAITLRNRGDEELLGPVPSPPLARKAERGMRVIEADDHGKGVAAILVHVFDGAVHEESRFHGRGGQAMILTPRIEPDGDRVDEGPPFLAMVAPRRRMLLEVGQPLGHVDAGVEPVPRWAVELPLADGGRPVTQNA